MVKHKNSSLPWLRRAAVTGVLLVGVVSAACNDTKADRATGGVELHAASGCPAGIAAMLGDPNYLSSQVALTALDGSVLSASFFSTASAQTEGLAFALSGDAALPSNPPTSGRVVILDRYGTNVITWLVPATAKVQAQLAVGTGFESNPQDYLELDGTRALVSRWGTNGNPNQQPFDAGNDLLVIDTRAPSILASVALPWHDELPPRPAAITQLGGSVAVVLQRLAEDFATQGDAEIVRVDPTSLAILQDLRLVGVSNCGRLIPRPAAMGFGLVCTGPLDRYGSSEDLSKSALLLLDVDEAGDLVERARWSAAEITSEPLQSDLSFAGQDLALVKTQTPQGGSTNNRLLALDLGTHAVATLAEARPGSDGTGAGLAFESLLCSTGCSPLCLLADSDQGLLRRFDVAQQPIAELSPIDMTPGVGLLPRQLAPIGAP